LLAEEKATFIDRTKQQARGLALAGQIKIEELKIGSSNQGVGEAILGSKENLALKCNHTESVLKATEQQRQRVIVSEEKHKTAEEAAAQCKAECGAKLGRTSILSSNLKKELSDTKKSLWQNANQFASVTNNIVMGALGSEVLQQSPELGESLTRLKAATIDKVQMKYPIAMARELESVGARITAARIRWSSIGSAFTIVWVLFMAVALVWRIQGFFGNSGTKAKAGSSTASTPSVSKPSIDSRQLERDANSRYFSTLCRSHNLFLQSRKANASEASTVVKAIDQAMRNVSIADTKNVDQTLQSIVLDYIQVLSEFRASYSELAYNQSGETLGTDMVEAFIRGANGDYYGKSLEVIERNRKLTLQINRTDNALQAIVNRANARGAQLGLSLD